MFDICYKNFSVAISYQCMRGMIIRLFYNSPDTVFDFINNPLLVCTDILLVIDLALVEWIL